LAKNFADVLLLHRGQKNPRLRLRSQNDLISVPRLSLCENRQEKRSFLSNEGDRIRAALFCLKGCQPSPGSCRSAKPNRKQLWFGRSRASNATPLHVTHQAYQASARRSHIAVAIAFRSLRWRVSRSPFSISMSISVTCNGTRTYSNPPRRRFR
jgi:hypothetical protein